MFKYTLDNKRYHTLNYYLRNKFGKKVFKVPLDAGFGCPNNSKCIYCSNQSKSNIINSKDSIVEQFYNNVKVLEKKWPDSLYIAYFQTGTNTNCSRDSLEPLIKELLKIDNVVGISISTRPDSISEDIYNYLDDLNKRTFLTVELGLQSSNNNTLKNIKRGHTKEEFEECVNKLHKSNIFVVAHIINGLPNETEEDMLNTIDFLNKLNIEGLKIHMLFIEKNTEIANMYLNNEFHLLEKDEYIDIVIKQLERLDSKIVIERITGDPVKENLIAPSWLLKKFVVLNDIDKEMVKRNTYQGIEKER